MYKVTKYPHGTFSWAENSSTDPDLAVAFYMDLFGWSKYEIPIDENNTYTMFQHQGQNVAALSGMLPEGVPSLWFNYVTVNNVDALAQVVTDNGGTITYGPWDVFDSGRLLHIADPEGAHLGLWQPKQHIGAGIVNTVGAMCWNELLTRDAEAAKAFYSAVLGWEFDGDENYIDIRNRGRSNGDILQLDESFGEMPPMWMVYFRVADIDVAMKRVEELGGRVVTQKMEAPNTGWFTVVEDPAGAVFYIKQFEKADTWEE